MCMCHSVCMCCKNRLISLAKNNHCSALILGSVQVPFLCTVSIGGMVYSSGRATTKKQAKHAAGWLEKYTLVR